jgi:hypothetical protein
LAGTAEEPPLPDRPGVLTPGLADLLETRESRIELDMGRQVAIPRRRGHDDDHAGGPTVQIIR